MYVHTKIKGKIILKAREHHSLSPLIDSSPFFSERMCTTVKLTSEKGKPMLDYEGFIYTLDRQTEAKMISRCQDRDYKGRCHSNSITNAIVSGPTEHSRTPSPDRVPVVN